MKLKSLFAPAALAFAALLAMPANLPAQEPTAEPVSPEMQKTRDLLAAFFDALDAGDLVKMKAKYAELQASYPKSEYLGGPALEIAMIEKDWPAVKRLVETMPADSLREIKMESAFRSIGMGQWEGAPKELFAVMAKEVDAQIKADDPPTAANHLLACSVQWNAGDQAKATEYARKALQLVKEAKEPVVFREATERFLKKVEGGTLPSMVEFAGWVQEGLSDIPIEPLAPDLKFDATAHVGNPVEIKFTAADGSEVDLAKLKGKVVLIDFWATWCAPCVEEIPHLKEVYQKYHDKGFEVIGISFESADGKDKMMKFTKDKGMPWPQYYDGKGWNNTFGRKYSIEAIPTMWLIDKQGNLADSTARENLAAKVEKLLGS